MRIQIKFFIIHFVAFVWILYSQKLQAEDCATRQGELNMTPQVQLTDDRLKDLEGIARTLEIFIEKVAHVRVDLKSNRVQFLCHQAPAFNQVNRLKESLMVPVFFKEAQVFFWSLHFDFHFKNQTIGFWAQPSRVKHPILLQGLKKFKIYELTDHTFILFQNNQNHPKIQMKLVFDRFK